MSQRRGVPVCLVQHGRPFAVGELRKTHRGLLTAWCDQPHSIVGCLNRKVVRRIANEETL